MTEFERPCYPQGSEKYEECISALSIARKRQYARNQWTYKMRNGQADSVTEEPPPPEPRDYKAIFFERDWQASLQGMTDNWWFNRILTVTQDPFLQAKIASLVFWDQAEKIKLPEVRSLFGAYDFTKDLFTDCADLEYLLHRIGYTPTKARSMAADSAERAAWRIQCRKTYFCTVCLETQTGIQTLPERCPACGAIDSLKEKTNIQRRRD